MNLLHVIGPIESSTPQPLPCHVAMLWGHNALLAQAVGSYLETLNWKVVRISGDDTLEYFIREMKRLHPEVVILCQDTSDDSSLPWRLIDEKLCPKVLTIGMDSNLMHVYSRQEILLQETTDLLSILDPGHLNSVLEKEVDRQNQTHKKS